MENVQLSVSDFVALVNQTLEYAYPTVAVVGEVSEFRVSQGKWVSFKLKDEDAVIDCFMAVYQLRVPVENGMKLLVTAAPRLNAKWGKFSLNVRAVKPVGEGSIKKGFELLKAKLQAEGLFAQERKRPLPRIPTNVALITSTESAAYADFCKIINERWGGLKIDVAHTQVQGDPAADQIINAIKYFNNREVLPDVLVIIRGGGSAEDLMSFNDELLAREIAGSRIPTLVGVGHEVDHTLADMVADRRAATPTNAAELLAPDRREVIQTARRQAASTGDTLIRAIDQHKLRMAEQLEAAYRRINERLEGAFDRLTTLKIAVNEVNPENVLRRGYALVRGKLAPGDSIEIETYTSYVTAEVQNVREK